MLFSVNTGQTSPSMGHKKKEVDGPEVILVFFWPSSWEALAVRLFNAHSGSQYNEESGTQSVDHLYCRVQIFPNRAFYSFTQFLAKAGIIIQVLF